MLFREILKILKTNFFKEQRIVKENRGFFDLRLKNYILNMESSKSFNYSIATLKLFMYYNISNPNRTRVGGPILVHHLIFVS
jgi:hypothetical protein